MPSKQELLRLWKSIKTQNQPGANPGFSERGLLLFNKSFFHKKKHGKNICISL